MSRIFFVTIRCPKQIKPWIRIGKASDWARRYSKDYYVVMSPKNGIHFHIIMGVPPHTTLKPSKGIHFHIKALSDKVDPTIQTFSPPTTDELEDIRKAKYFSGVDRLKMIMKLKIPHECIHCSNIIQKYFARKASSDQRKVLRTKKNRKVQSVIDYMTKNLYEDRQENYYPETYIDYILKNLPTQGHSTPLVSGM